MSPPNLLEDAHHRVSGDRMAAHGHPGPNLARTAALWRAAFGWNVNAGDVAFAQMLFKVAREIGQPHRDNLVDIAGYARVIEMTCYDENSNFNLPPTSS